MSFSLENFKRKRCKTKKGIIAQAIANICQGLGVSVPRADADLTL